MQEAAQTEANPQKRLVPYEMLGGEVGIRDLASAFYDAMNRMKDASDIRQMHKDNLGEIKQKLFEFLSGWLGGPRLYAEKYGTICLTDPHAPFQIGPDQRNQWLACMDAALVDVGADDDLRELLKRPFAMIADSVRNAD